jgi:hypothetical protein
MTDPKLVILTLKELAELIKNDPELWTRATDFTIDGKQMPQDEMLKIIEQYERENALPPPNPWAEWEED